MARQLRHHAARTRLLLTTLSPMILLLMSCGGQRSVLSSGTAGGSGSSGSSAPAAAQLVFNPTPVQFSNVAVGQPQQKAVTLTNAGAAPAQVTDIAVSGSGFAATPAQPLPWTLQPKDSESLTVTFDPSSSGTANGAVAVTADTAAATLPLSGNAQGAHLIFNPTGLDFGNVAVGSQATLPLTIQNQGNASATVTLSVPTASGFSVSPTTPVTIAASTSAEVNVTFTPPSADDPEADLTAAVSGGPTLSVPLTGNLHGPVLFTTDLLSGPKTGGENNRGIYVCVYGNDFGATRGTATITVGGGELANYKSWSNTKACGQLGANAQSGNVVLTTSAGASNGLPFTVRSGHIHFVSASAGSDSNVGSFGAPFATIKKCRQAMSPGDFCVLRAGTYTAADDYGATLTMDDTGATSEATSFTFDGYPGETVTLGTAGSRPAIITPGVSGDFSWHNVYNLATNSDHGGVELAGTATHLRLIGDSFDCAAFTVGGGSACMAGNPKANYLTILEDTVDHVGDAPGTAITKLDHGIYLAGHDIEIGWSTVAHVAQCRGIQFHATALGYGDASMSAGSKVLTAAGSHTFSAGDVGERIDVFGAGPGGGTLYSTIAAFTDATHVTLADVAATTVAAASYKWGGSDEYNISIHDNRIHDIRCDALNFSTVNPSKGAIKVYNNVIYNAGTGPDPTDGGANSSCVYSAQTTDSVYDGDRGGNIQVYNNTFYNCGSGGSYGRSTISIGKTSATGNVGIVMKDNIVRQPQGQPYVAGNGIALLSGTNNDWFGNGAAPSQTSSNLSVDPGLLSSSTTTSDFFHLLSSSPLLGAGVNTPALRDIEGNPRPTGKFDLGAYQAEPQ